jgi:hypothetical protein
MPPGESARVELLSRKGDAYEGLRHPEFDLVATGNYVRFMRAVGLEILKHKQCR